MSPRFIHSLVALKFGLGPRHQPKMCHKWRIYHRIGTGQKPVGSSWTALPFVFWSRDSRTKRPAAKFAWTGGRFSVLCGQPRRQELSVATLSVRWLGPSIEFCVEGCQGLCYLWLFNNLPFFSSLNKKSTKKYICMYFACIYICFDCYIAKQEIFWGCGPVAWIHGIVHPPSKQIDHFPFIFIRLSPIMAHSSLQTYHFLANFHPKHFIHPDLSGFCRCQQKELMKHPRLCCQLTSGSHFFPLKSFFLFKWPPVGAHMSRVTSAVDNIFFPKLRKILKNCSELI